jgi:ABC-type multidrug transport system ATPase subunit
VLTSHRPSLIYQADQVYVIEDGRVTSKGRPSELMEQEGWFSRFMRSAEEAMPSMDGASGRLGHEEAAVDSIDSQGATISGAGR